MATSDSKLDLIRSVIKNSTGTENEVTTYLRRGSILEKQYSCQGRFILSCIQDDACQFRRRQDIPDNRRYPYYSIADTELKERKIEQIKESDVNVHEGEETKLDKIREYAETYQIGSESEEVEFKNFLNKILFEIVHKGSLQELERFLDWFHNELLTTPKNEQIWGKWREEIKAKREKDAGTESWNQPFIEASLSNSIDKVHVFLSNGFQIDDEKFKRFEDWEKEHRKFGKENKGETCLGWLTRKLPVLFYQYLDESRNRSSSQGLVNFHATSTPAYLLSEYVRDIVKNRNPGDRIPHVPNNDPVSEAFLNAYIAEHWMTTISNNYSHEKLQEILSISQKFVVDMLKQCKTHKEAALFFAFDSKLKSYYQEDKWNQLSKNYPRLSMAIECNYMDIATNEYSQFILGQHWVMSDINGKVVQWYNTNMVDKGLCLLRNIIFTPVHVFCYLTRVLVDWDYYENPSPALKFDKDKGDSSSNGETSKSWIAEKMDNNEIFSHFSTHYSFPVNRYIGSLISHICFLVLIFIAILNPNDKENVIDIDWYDKMLFIWSTAFVLEYISQNIRQILCIHWSKKYLRSMKNKIDMEVIFWHMFRLASYLSIFLGLVCKLIGYTEYCYNDMSLNFDHCNLKDSVVKEIFRDNSVTKIGYGIFGIGFTLNTIRILYWAQLNSTTGVVIITMIKTIKDVFRFLLIFVLFLGALAIGMNYMLKYSSEYCDGEPGYNVTTRLYYNRNTSEVIATDDEVFDIEKLENKFRSVRSSLKTAMWSLFDPGHPEVVGCTKAPLRYLGLGMWGLYQFVNVVILLNLVIALMNSTVISVDANRIKEWRFARTKIWNNYIDKNNSIPIPFNILEYFVWILVKIFRSIRNRTCKGITETSKADDMELQAQSVEYKIKNKREKYNSLMLELRKRYIENNTKKNNSEKN